MAEFNGIVSGAGRRFAVLASRFNHHITEKLAEGALDALVRHGAAAEDVMRWSSDESGDGTSAHPLVWCS